MFFSLLEKIHLVLSSTKWIDSLLSTTLREKCPNTEFILVRIFPHLDWIRRDTLYSVWMWENTDQEQLRIWTLFTQYKPFANIFKFYVLIVFDFCNVLMESAKLRAWRACVLACLACLRACLLTCLRAYVPACPRAWHAYVLGMLVCTCFAYVLPMMRAWRVYH